MLQLDCTLFYPRETVNVGYFPGISVPHWSIAKYKDAEHHISLSLMLSVSSTPIPPMLRQFWKNCLKHKTGKVRVKRRDI